MMNVVVWVTVIISIPFLYFCSGVSLLCVLVAFTLKAGSERVLKLLYGPKFSRDPVFAVNW